MFGQVDKQVGTGHRVPDGNHHGKAAKGHFSGEVRISLKELMPNCPSSLFPVVHREPSDLTNAGMSTRGCG